MKRIKIIKCSPDGVAYWYINFIGLSFEYITESDKYYHVTNHDFAGLVLKEDGEVIEDEIQTHPLLKDLLVQQKNNVNQVFGPGLSNQNVVNSKIMDTTPYDRITTVCEKCGMPFCICKTKIPDGAMNIPKEKLREFETGAKRDNSDNKPNVHDMQGYTLLRFGYHLKKGELHYGKSNYLKGIPSDVALESLARHYAKYHNGDRKEDHLSAILFNTQILMLNEEKEGVKVDKYFENEK